MSSSTEPSPSGDRRARVRRAVRRTVLARRRPLAAGCAAVAVLAGVHAVRPPAPRAVAVTVAAHDLPSGTVLRAEDLVVRKLPADSAPVGSQADAIGRTLAAPVRRGEPVTDVRLVAPSLIDGYPGRVALPVRIADADAVALLRAGDHVDLVVADPRRGSASYVAVDVPVLALPAPSDHDAGTPGLTGRLVVVAALPSDVDRIAGAAATDLLSIVISR
ncbi:MAG TPA: SAF domain-containing protein [Nocardioides sp.]|uniref:SAF domain-containing protein n=1 Tax=Nocardioides sp. TaxID=35761 RepID=UPI002F3F51F3